MKRPKLALLCAGACLCLAVPSALAQTRILPLGDSVTSSFAPYSSYRYWLDHYLHHAGINFDFVGTSSGVANGTPDQTDFDQDYSGGPGWTTYTALGQIGSIAATDPDIVLLNLGANDISAGESLDTIKQNIETIIDDFRSVNPNVVILLAQPTPSTDISRHDMLHLKKTLGSVARHYGVQGSPVIRVDLFDGFSPRRDTFDGTHPNRRGERIIARKFFFRLRPLIR